MIAPKHLKGLASSSCSPFVLMIHRSDVDFHFLAAAHHDLGLLCSQSATIKLATILLGAHFTHKPKSLIRFNIASMHTLTASLAVVDYNISAHEVQL